MTDVQKYNPLTNSWDLVSCMPTARWRCLVAVLPTNEIITVGGCIGSASDTSTDKMEVAGLTYL